MILNIVGRTKIQVSYPQKKNDNDGNENNNDDDDNSAGL